MFRPIVSLIIHFIKFFLIVTLPPYYFVYVDCLYMLTLEINKLNSVGFCQVSFFIGNGFGSFQIKLSQELISASFLGFHIALYFF